MYEMRDITHGDENKWETDKYEMNLTVSADQTSVSGFIKFYFYGKEEWVVTIKNGTAHLSNCKWDEYLPQIIIMLRSFPIHTLEIEYRRQTTIVFLIRYGKLLRKKDDYYHDLVAESLKRCLEWKASNWEQWKNQKIEDFLEEEP